MTLKTAKPLYFAAIGDLHFDVPPRYGFEPTVLIELLDKIYEDCARLDYRHFFWLGDTFDKGSASQEHLGLLFDFFNKWKEYDTYIIAGNHDIKGGYSLHLFEKMARAKTMPGVHIYSEPWLEKIEDQKVNFLPFPHTTGVRNALNIGHFTLRGSFADNGYVLKNEGMDAKELIGKHWILGHLHTAQSPYYPGTIYQTKFGESQDKGYVLGKYSGKNLELKRVSVSHCLPFYLETVIISKSEDLKQLKTYRQDPKTVYSLVVAEDVVLPLDVRQVYNIQDIKTANGKRQATQMARGRLELGKSQLGTFDISHHLQEFAASKAPDIDPVLVHKKAIEMGLIEQKEEVESLEKKRRRLTRFNPKLKKVKS